MLLVAENIVFRDKKCFLVVSLLLITFLSGCAGGSSPLGLGGLGDQETVNAVREIGQKATGWFGFSHTNEVRVTRGDVHNGWVHYDARRNILILDREYATIPWESLRLHVMREMIQAAIWQNGEPFDEIGIKENDFFALSLAAYIFHADIFQESFDSRTLFHRIRYSWNTGQNQPSWDRLIGLDAPRIRSSEDMLLPLSVAYFMLDTYGTKDFVECLYFVARNGQVPLLKQRLGYNFQELEAEWKRYYGLQSGRRLPIN